MADGYHIYIHLGELTGESSVAGEQGGGETKERETSSKADKTAQSAYRAVKRMVSYASVRSVADKLLSYQIEQVELKTGAVEYEQRLSSSYNIGKQVLDAGVSLGVGIATGTWPLVVIGMVTQGINKLIEIGQTYQRLAREESLEGVSIRMQTVRAGATGRRGG